MPYLILIAAMALVVLASNVLVQFPFQVSIGSYPLSDVLTWGAFTYPVSFLVTDLANRAYGPALARRVVFSGFVIAVIAALMMPQMLSSFGLISFETEAGRLQRIAIASGIAFLIGQLLDIGVFNRLRADTWWKAPVIGSLIGSAADTAIFFTLAFSSSFLILGPSDGFALESAPFLGLYSQEFPRWLSWAAGDFGVKMLIAILALLPYRIFIGQLKEFKPS